MHLSENGRWLIMRLEGGRLRAYQCRAGIWTIGYGHTEGVKPGDKISLDQALELFNHDVQWAVDAVNALVTVPLSQGQFEALCSFVFNVGRSAFAQSRLLKKLNAGDVVGAAAEFPRWDRGGPKSHIIPGLTRRRAEELAHFLS